MKLDRYPQETIFQFLEFYFCFGFQIFQPMPVGFARCGPFFILLVLLQPMRFHTPLPLISVRWQDVYTLNWIRKINKFVGDLAAWTAQFPLNWHNS